ncbi:MAG: hypothetical protein M5U34_21965 [Chloroflexi bacterium]|nr:hypothetical protein [Chloroflexota bacterium]
MARVLAAHCGTLVYILVSPRQPGIGSPRGGVGLLLMAVMLVEWAFMRINSH